jgi:hypothetical protein
MRSSVKQIIFIASMALILAGCKKNFNISDKQAILFQLDYVNYAWGYQHNGYIIDKDGNILIYNNPENWNFPDNNFGLTEHQVSENIASCYLSERKIAKDELQKYSNYINNIASTKITALKNVAADAGSLEYICYQYSENSGMYKGTLIKKEGDFTCENLNFYSKKVASWMREVNNSLAKK